LGASFFSTNVTSEIYQKKKKKDLPEYHTNNILSDLSAQVSLGSNCSNKGHEENKDDRKRKIVSSKECKQKLHHIRNRDHIILSK
jgi:hypothetical protein